MLFRTAGQSLAFLFMLSCGVKIGVCHDALRLLRRLFRPGAALSLALDLSFGAGAAALLIASLVRALDGELRLYALMGALAGFLLYGATLSRLLAFVARRAAQRLRSARARFAGSAFAKKLLK